MQRGFFFFQQKRAKRIFFFFQQKRAQPQQNICWSSSLRRCRSNIKKYQLWNFEEKQIFFKKKFHPNWISSKKVFQDVFCFAQQNYGQGQENISEDSGLRRCFSNVEKHQLWKFEEKKNLEFLDLILFFSPNCPCWCKEDFFFSAKACKEDFFLFSAKASTTPTKHLLEL